MQEERGRLRADSFLEVEGWPGVWALGDCASVPDAQTGKPFPPTAQHALRQGKVVAAQHRGGGARAAVSGRSTSRPSASSPPSGGGRAWRSILGVNFSGFVAWWLWRTIYLSKLPRFEKKLRVALDWTLDLLFTKDLVQFLTLPAPAVSHGEAGNRRPEKINGPAKINERVLAAVMK